MVMREKRKLPSPTKVDWAEDFKRWLDDEIEEAEANYRKDRSSGTAIHRLTLKYVRLKFGNYYVQNVRSTGKEP